MCLSKKSSTNSFFESDMGKYYSALNFFDETKDISKMVDFLEEESYRTWIRSIIED